MITAEEKMNPLPRERQRRTKWGIKSRVGIMGKPCPAFCIFIRSFLGEGITFLGHLQKGVSTRHGGSWLRNCSQDWFTLADCRALLEQWFQRVKLLPYVQHENGVCSLWQPRLNPAAAATCVFHSVCECVWARTHPHARACSDIWTMFRLCQWNCYVFVGGDINSEQLQLPLPSLPLTPLPSLHLLSKDHGPCQTIYNREECK